MRIEVQNMEAKNILVIENILYSGDVSWNIPVGFCILTKRSLTARSDKVLTSQTVAQKAEVAEPKQKE